MESEIFIVGDIVTLKSHPYHEKITNIIISGEHTLLPPLMIISETHEVKARKISDEDKEKIVQIECTCIWFSSRFQKFEKAKIKNVHLKKIESPENSAFDVEEGQLVVLNTLGMELGKRKSSITFEDLSSDSNSGRLTTNSYLSFVSPIMHVITPKEIKTNTGAKGTKINVKCLWYNHSSERFSEIVLPKEALILIGEIETKVLVDLDNAIKNSKFLLWKEEDKNQILCKPYSLSFRNGYYHINAYDFLLNRATDITITSKVTFKIINNPFRTTAPQFNLEKNKQAFNSENVKTELNQAISNSVQNKSYIRIKYKNQNDKVTLRSLRNYKLLQVEEDGKNAFYLEGYCLSKQDKRVFRIDRIQDFQELILKFE